MEILPEVQNTKLLAILGDFEGIDGGEKLLFAAAAEAINPMLITGDRKALRALLEHQANFPDVVAVLQDAVVTFESAILLAIHKIGFAIVKQKLLGSPKPDGIFWY